MPESNKRLITLHHTPIRLSLVLTVIVGITTLCLALSYHNFYKVPIYWSSSVSCLVAIITLGLLWRKTKSTPKTEPVLIRSVYWVGSLLSILAFASLGLAIFASWKGDLPARVLI
jgi:hypothetical protein